MSTFARQVLEVAKQIQQEVPRHEAPPDEGFPASTESVLPHSIVRGTRGYIEQVVNQINGCYEKGWFDGCAVMMRRLVETLIIEVFEKHGIADKIKNDKGDFFFLKDLISKTLSEPSWNLGRNCKEALPRLKDVGDKSAHNRRFNAHKKDIDKLIDDVRVVSQEFVYLAGWKERPKF